MLKTLGGAKRARILITLTAICSMVLAMLVAGVSPVKADNPDQGGYDSVLSLTKEVSKHEVDAGHTFVYDLYVQCSSHTTNCKDVELTDQLDPRFEITVPSHIDHGGNAVLSSGNKLTVKWGTLADGSQAHVQLGVKVPADGEFTNGENVPNVADVTASNAAPKTDNADIKINVKHELNVNGAIALSPNAVYAKAPHEQNRTTSARYSVTNDSTRIAPVKSLTIENSREDFFNYFNLAQNNAGKVNQLPNNANRVVVSVLEGGVWKSTAAQAVVVGTELTLPAGVNKDNVTSVRYTFSNASGQDIAKTGNKTGRVDLPLILRDNERGNNNEINPSQAFDVRMYVKPSLDGLAENGTPQTKVGAELNAPIKINPLKIEIGVNYNFYRSTNANPYSTANRSTSGIIAGTTDQNVVSLVEATNNSGFAINNMTIETPYDAYTFGAFKPTHYRVLLPAGAHKAVVTIKCSNGAEFTAEHTSNQNSVAIPCASGSRVASGKVVFLSESGKFQIGNGATGTFGFNGQMDGTQTTGNAVSNYIKVTADNPVNSGGAFAKQETKAITVTAPSQSIGSRVKSVNVKDIIPGQEMTWTLAFRNSGNQPLTNATMVDPEDPAVNSSPWDKLRITSVSNNQSGTVQLFDPNTNSYVAYDASNAALLARATGIKVTHASLAASTTSTTTVKAVLRDNVPANQDLKIRNCMVTWADGINRTSTCTTGGDLTVVPAGRAASINKSFPVHSVERGIPGSPADTVQTRLTAENEGPALLRNFTLVDKGTHKAAGDPNFFDAVDFKGNSIQVNRMIGSTHAKVWFCDFGTGCDTDDWKVVSNNGSAAFVALANNNTISIPVKTDAVSRVGGIKVQFATNSTGTGAALITEDANVGTGTCAGATVCFDVQPRITLFTDANQLIPNTIHNGVTGIGETVALDGMVDTTFNVAMADANFEMIEGKPQLHLTKTPNGSLNPGGSHKFVLNVENTGKAVVSNPKIVDVIPAELDYDAVKGYAISYGDGQTVPAAPSLAVAKDGNDKATKMTWAWSNYDLLPGETIKVEVFMSLMPGTPGDKQITNVAGVTGAQFVSGDNGNTVPGIDQPCKNIPGKIGGGELGESPTEVYCSDSAYVTTHSGNGFASAKWITGNPDLGFYNSVSKEYVDAEACPTLNVGGKTYTRFPCTALILPGEEFDYVLRLTNMGTNPVNEVRIIDGLPVEGDKGVILDDLSRGTNWTNRPVLSSPVVAQERDGMTAKIGYNNSLVACTDSLTDANAESCDYTDAWSAGTGSFQTQLKFAEGKLLAPGEFVDLAFSMDSPYDVGEHEELALAWNSIAQNAWAVEPSGNVRELKPAEPNKVGIGMLHSLLDIEKVINDQSDGQVDTKGPFLVDFKCTANEGDFTLEGKDIAITEGRNTLTKKVFPGVECEIWETSTGGAVSSADVDNKLKVEIPMFEYSEGDENRVPVSVGLGEITNTFNNPPVDPPTGPTEPAVTPTDNPADPSDPAVTPTDGANNDDQGVLPHTGAGMTLMAALLALILIGGGLVLRYASRQRKH